jgi:hypothetical protein
VEQRNNTCDLSADGFVKLCWRASPRQIRVEWDWSVGTLFLHHPLVSGGIHLVVPRSLWGRLFTSFGMDCVARTSEEADVPQY